MKKLLRMLVTCCLTFTAASIAQGTQQTPLSSTNPPEHSAPSMQQDSQPGSMASSMNKGDKAPHVGYTVTVHGSFLPSTETSSAGQGSDFLVKQIGMVADRCTLESQKAMKEH